MNSEMESTYANINRGVQVKQTQDRKAKWAQQNQKRHFPDLSERRMEK